MSTLTPSLTVPTPTAGPARAAGTLLSALQAGELRVALTFAGNGTPWVPELRSLVESCPAAWDVIAEASDRLRDFALDQRVRWAGLVPGGFEVEGWVAGTTPLPSAEVLSSSTVSQPGIFLAQVARVVQLRAAGLDLATLAKCADATSGYSQGVMTAVLVAEAAQRGTLAPSRVADFAIYLAWQGLFMAECWRNGAPRPAGEGSPMVAISGPTHDTLAALVASVPTVTTADGRDSALVISMANSRTRHVVSGAPTQLAQLQATLDARVSREAALRKQGRHGGAVLRFTWDPLPVECAFHSPYMASGMAPMRAILAELGFTVRAEDLAFDVLDTCTGENLREAPDLLERLLELQYVEPVRWVAVTQAIARRKPDLVLDFGAGPGIARVTASGLRGHGVRLLSLSEPSGRRDLLSTDRRRLPKPNCYADFAPSLVQLADGSVQVDNAYSRATGQPPMILPGMTPTTADVPLVAAAANAGYTAELAGGGQVTERIFDLRMAELRDALAPGVEVTFNALFMDRYLWGLHFGAEKLVQKARKAGLPIAGVTVSAGIPDVDEGVRLLDEFAALGMRLNAFKPGTAKQVDQVLAIADAAPRHTVFLHLEGGKAGGHHSWEDLEDLLLTCYDKIRQRANVVLCVGGGVADEARATALIVGDWSLGHGLPAMPVDAVLLGTVTMACLEAGTSPQVKAALAQAGGTPAWVPSGGVVGGVTSGKSQLDADIHYLDNAAAACGRLLDTVAGDAEAIAARKGEIVAALNRTAKPYFGDLLDMTWQQALERLVALLAVGRDGRYEDGVWPDVSYRARVADLLRLAEARLLGREGVDAGASVLTDLRELDAPADVLAAFAARYPSAAAVGPHPADVETFVRTICARPGKPVNFVPVIDADVRRWFKSDSLWQAHDDRFAADQVLTIPGPEAVRGILRADEPVAELLGRFTGAVVSRLRAGGQAPSSRRWLATPRAATLPGGVRVDTGEGVATWQVSGAVDADCWFAPLAARYDGLVAQVFAAEAVYVDGAAQRNPVHSLCLAEPGASLWIEPAHGAAHALTWRSAPAREAHPREAGQPAPGETVRLTLAAQGRVQLTLDVRTLAGAAQAAAPLTRTFHVDASGKVHLAPLTGAVVRAFYDAHLFGAPQQSAALFAEAVDDAAVQPLANRAYGRLSANLSEDVAGSQVFSLGFRAMMRALSCDELAPGLLSLVHLSHAVRPQAGWPVVAGETLTTRARVVRVACDASGGTEVRALVRVLRGDVAVAEADEAFYLRGFAPPAGLRLASETRLDTTLWLGDAAAAQLATQRLGLATPAAAGTTLHLCGPLTERRDHERVTFGASLTVRDESGATRGTWSIDRHAPADHAGQHPALALAAVLAPTPSRVETPAADLATALVQAPTDLATWSEVSGDANPIHRSLLVARMAGLPGPIVHGMWTAARARAFAVARLCDGDAARLRGLEVRFVAPLLPGAELELRATRVGAERGCEIVRVQALTLAGPALEAEATVAPPTTAYVFPGQGIQQPGMGMDAYQRSAAARAVWDAADAFTRAHLGFSLLHVVRDNPKELLCQGRRDVHKRGVLYLTQYTQVAMATLARAQVAELKEAGALVPGAVVCGHSIGEYNALSAVAEVLPLETVVAVVWHRGLTMHTCVPRDAEGKSGYAMGVIRPHHAGLDHDGALALVAEVAAETQGFVEIVNFNVRDRQYSTVGDLPTLATLERRLGALRKPGGKAPWVTVPGIDVPFHSTRLRDGVPAFRATLQRLLPPTGYLNLVGTYVPNLVAVPFALTPAFVEEMVAATVTVDARGERAVAPEIQALRGRFDAEGAVVGDPDDLARELVVELFAFQFASPVRWIESQDVLMRPVSAGGLGVRRFVEVGVGYQPTTANMAKQTLRALGDAAPAMAVLNIEADGDAVKLRGGQHLASLLTPAAAPETAAAPEAAERQAVEPAAAVPAAPPAAEAAAEAAAPAAAVAASAAPSDQAVSHLDGLRTLLALQAKIRAEQVGVDETIDDVFGGVSSRRNQALVDMGAEFDAGAIDGAHEVPVGKLAGLLAERASGWRCPGGYLRKAQDEAIRRVFGRAGLNRDAVGEKLAQRYGLGAGLTAAALNTLALEERAGDSARGEALGKLAGVVASSAAEVEPALDQLVAALGAQTGLALGPLSTGSTAGGAAVDAAVVAELEARILGPNGVLAGSVADLGERLARATDATDDGTSTARAQDAAELATLRAELGALHGEHGEGWLAMVAPRFSAQQHVAFTSAWAWARRDVATLFHDVARGAKAVGDEGVVAAAARLARFAGDPVVADRARYFAAQAADRGLGELAALLTQVADGDAPRAASLVPSRPQVDVDSAGRRSFREVPDPAPDAVARLAADLRAAPEGRQPHVQLGDEAADAALWQALLADAPLDFSGRTALVTGASPGSIAVEVVRHLLRGGARVVVTTSSPRRSRMAWYSALYQQEAAPGAELHVVPFNQASFQDVDALVTWLFDRVTEPDGAKVRELKGPFAPDLVVPFAALGDAATANTLGPRAEAAIRVMLTGVERLVATIGARYAEQGQPARPAHVVLPLSPNHGGFGGDGAYAETKAGLEVLLNKWASERDAWAAATTLCAARIGWVRGTGLMDANDGVAAALESRTGARTFANSEMGWLLAGLCALAEYAREAPLEADLTGGFGRIADIREVVSGIRADLDAESRTLRELSALEAREAGLLGVSAAPEAPRVRALPAWPAVSGEGADVAGLPDADWPVQQARLEDTVVIVGAGELGPCGSARTRWALEVEDTLSAAAVLELAWMCGLITWREGARGGTWVDVASDSPVAEADIGDRYRDAVRAASGIRWTEPDMAGFDPDDLPVLAVAWLDRDFTFDVADAEEAQAFLDADPEHTSAQERDGRWQVTRRAGAEVRVPRRAKLNRKVLGMLPTGLNYGRFGLPGDMVESVDRVTLMNLIATADAFLDAGLTPEELLAEVHPARVANTQGSGLGGMQSLRRLFTDQLLDRERQGDIVQEMLINVVAAYTVQSYVGSYGPMVHPVGACATAAVSLEEGMDKILSGRADFSVAGGFDDVTAEGVLGFSDMQATADTAKMAAMGLDPDQMSRANDLRRRGFVEAQGGGTLLLCRGDVARDLGLPVRGVLAWAGSFSDGVHTSIPAPGLGVVAAAMGGQRSPLGRSLARHGLSTDDIALIYKHDTSTAANDPNENLIHNTIQRALGRTAGNPLFVVSQKTLTGHSKGGAAAFQAIGLCQSLAQGTIAGNRNLECVDPDMRRFEHLAFTDTAVQCATPLRAGLVTSLGFGHVGAIALVVHPAAFAAQLAAEGTLDTWRSKAEARETAALRRRVDVLLGRAQLFERRSERPISAQEAELAMLLDPEGRIAPGTPEVQA